MKLTYVLTIVLTLGAATAGAQGPPPAQTSPTQTPTQTPVAPPLAEPVPAAVPEAVRPLTPADVRRRRDAITLMEGVLAAAVRLGATATARELQAVQPGLTMFTTSIARAKGVYLEGYGVFFQVEIPGVRPSVVSMIETLSRDRANRENALPASAGSVTSMPSAMRDPDAAYVEAVKAALIDAMLDYSKALELRTDEWLAIAARGDDVPMMPGEIFESRPMILRIRGTDLAEFLASRLTKDEVRRRVQVREF
jgi:hypothetical protein